MFLEAHVERPIGSVARMLHAPAQWLSDPPSRQGLPDFAVTFHVLRRDVPVTCHAQQADDPYTMHLKLYPRRQYVGPIDIEIVATPATGDETDIALFAAHLPEDGHHMLMPLRRITGRLLAGAALDRLLLAINTVPPSTTSTHFTEDQ